MDWLLDPHSRSVIERATDAVCDHLQRHASKADSLDGAHEQVAAAMETIDTDTEGIVWAHLNWLSLHPRLSLSRIPAATAGTLGADLLPPESTGLTAVRPQHRCRLTEVATSPSLTFDLGVTRTPPADVDPEPGVLADLDVDPMRDGPAAAAVALAAAAEAHPAGSAEQVAAIAGSLLADAVLRHTQPTDARQAADLFAAAQSALGSTPTVAVLTDDRFEVTVEASPFGGRHHEVRSLTRMTQALAGRIAARVRGAATVVLEESVGFGGPVACLYVVLADSPEGVVGSTYRWPPGGDPAFVQGLSAPRLELAVSLPRESHSVPVVRRLAAQALRAFGVTPDDVSDVELAITEACANVVEHAVDSDSYEVSFELAADRCSITVVDRGAGFDATTVSEQTDLDAEGGRGLILMRALVENVYFTNEPLVGTVVHMVKPLHYDQGHPWRHAEAG